jgi:transposase
MNKLTIEKRRVVVACLVEGNSIRATVRMTGVAKVTVSKLLVDLGKACDLFQDEKVRNVRSNRIECDEIRPFVGPKAKNVPADKKDVWGDVMDLDGD